jgi:hypothetical protein
VKSGDVCLYCGEKDHAYGPGTWLFGFRVDVERVA